ncbi:MAG: YciI family protein [Bryobacterales bacterium]
MKFLCLAYEEEQKLNNLSEDEWLILRQQTLDYVSALQTSGRLLDTRPLRSATTASTLRVRDGKLQVTDGPFAETKEQIGGFFLIEVNDQEEAIQIAAKWPSAQIGSIEVRPIDEELRLDSRY